MKGLWVGGNYIWCLFIVVILMGLGEAKRLEGALSHPMGAGTRYKAETSFMEGVDPLDNMLDQINN